ncbi:ankyrin repeat and sterile alpha motif domain-containing protein 1B-like isoform X10 [Ostrea edulis]|uniref:ankyrin repeat and sterile alpha motif domain-containing protein 1B-like isoform X10 n=1 Tax=Ostrea edulis TaxID=37623 RepID=UPI0024AF1505|nr:ankyrin repeat and sterile alpha motif domain-containing protein 1B-like isoform X10 [Ostrea edulis]XP_055998046.1 ankyrin repeat and sterile alpha motif domain-containing protein 1B-like isoform X10 [Ostrea edulis]
MAAIRQLVGIDKDQELLEAARNGKCDVIEKLLKKSTGASSLLTNLSSLLKVNINCVDREKDTPLHLAALNGHVGAVEILLRENASVNVVDNRGCNPLHLASWKGNVKICEILLRNPHSQIQVNLQNSDGETPLHSAAQYGFTPTVKILLEYNADPTIRNLKDESPLDLAARYGRVEVVQCLIDKCPDLVQSPILIHSPLHLAGACGHKQIVENLLDKGFNINTKTEDGTALHLAALYCKPEVVKILLDRGIDCTQLNRDGKTVLQILTEQRNQSSYSELITLIKDHGNKVTQLESQDVNLYDTLVDHTSKPVPKPRLSMGSSPEMEKKSPTACRSSQVSVQYAKIDKSKTENVLAREDGRNAVSQKAPPPVPPRQSTIDGGDTSPVHRTIQEVSMERDSITFQNIQPFQPPFPLPPDNPTQAKPQPSRRSGNRQIVSMYDPSFSVEKSPKMWRAASSVQNLSLTDQPPAPCDVKPLQPGYMAMANSPVQSPKPNRPVKPQRKKKALSPVPKRSNSPKSSPERKENAPPTSCQSSVDSVKLNTGSDVTKQSTKSKESNFSSFTEEAAPAPCDNSKDCKDAGETLNDDKVKELAENKAINVDQSDLDVNVSKNDTKDDVEPTLEYEVMSQVKRPDTMGKGTDVQSQSSSLDRMDVIDTYQIASDVTRKSSMDRKDVIDTYQIAAHVGGKGDSIDRKDVIDTYQLAGEVAILKEEDMLPTPCPAGVNEEGVEVKESATAENKNTSKDFGLIPEETGVQYENNASVITAWGGREDAVAEEGTQYENNASVSRMSFPNHLRDSKGFTPMRESKGFSPLRDSQVFETKNMDGDSKNEENPYDATLFQQSKIVQDSENIPNAQSRRPNSDIPKSEDGPNKNVEEESKETSEVEYVNSCDRNSNIPKELEDGAPAAEVIYDVPMGHPPRKIDIPKPAARKLVDKSPSAEKPDIPKKPKPSLVPKPSLKSDKQNLVSATKKDNCDVPVCDITGGEYVTLTAPHPKEKSERLSNGVREPKEDTGQGIKPPGSLEFGKRRQTEGIPLTPTGYTQPPTPDFPPPSPHTALVGIEERMAVIDNKRSSKDMETITESNMMTDSQSQGHTTDTQNSKNPVILTAEEHEEPVVMRRASTRGSSSSMDDIVTDDKLGPFAGLYRGSVIGGPRTLVTQITDNVAQRNSWRKSLPGAMAMTIEPMKEESIEKKMATIAMSTHDPRMSRLHGKEEGGDDDEEWAKIADIVSSFGGDIGVYTDLPSFEAEIKMLNRDPGRILSVGEWLEEIGLGQYENTLVANGFDHTDFLGKNIMEDGDLETIGITSSEHRKKILDSAKSLSQITPIDPDNLPPSVSEWLNSLHLSDRTETFVNKNFDTMERVLKLWEVELTSVLDITAVGHRKRILASLENRKKLERQFPSLKKRSKDEDKASKEPELNLYKDYTKVKPLASSSEEESKVSQNSLPDSSEDEEVFRKEQGKALRDSSIHIRPPHQANTTTPIKQWRHRPEMLIKGCCNYSAQYLGSTLVRELVGTESTIEGITKLKKSADVIAKIPTILLSISFKGVKFIDAKSKKVICDHEIGNIFCACQDAHSMNFFAYITRDNQAAKHYCHVFSCRTADLAREIIMTLGEAFEVAYQMALKDKAMVEATEFEQKLSQSDTDDSSISSSKASINTV